MIRREFMFGVRPMTKWRSDALTNMTEAQSDCTSGASPPQHHETFQECRASVSAFFFAFWRPPTLFNDRRPCCFLEINYLSLFQWQRAAHWGRPCLRPRHTPGIYCKEKARVYSTQTCTIKTAFIQMLLSKPRDARQLSRTNADMLRYSQWHLAYQWHTGRKQKDLCETQGWKNFSAPLTVMSNSKSNETLSTEKKTTSSYYAK